MDKNSNIKATYVYANGQRVAKIKPDGTIIFYINDPLGNPLILMDEDGNIVKRYRFDPFGNLEAQWGTEPNHYLFTGKEKDESGLYYFSARYYNPRLGRFVTPDMYEGGAGSLWKEEGKIIENVFSPLKYAELTNPQSLNSYVYCLNNPLKYTDPTGHLYIEVSGIPIGNENSYVAEVYWHKGETTPIMSFLVGRKTVEPYAPAPAGEFYLSRPIRVAEYKREAMGPYKMIISEEPGGYTVKGRTWIELHAGRSSHKVPTYGCIRLDLEDMLRLVELSKIQEVFEPEEEHKIKIYRLGEAPWFKWLTTAEPDVLEVTY